MALPQPPQGLFHGGHPNNPVFVAGVPHVRIRVNQQGVQVYDATQPLRPCVYVAGQPCLVAPNNLVGGRRTRRRRLNKRKNTRRS